MFEVSKKLDGGDAGVSWCSMEQVKALPIGVEEKAMGPAVGQLRDCHRGFMIKSRVGYSSTYSQVIQYPIVSPHYSCSLAQVACNI